MSHICNHEGNWVLKDGDMVCRKAYKHEIPPEESMSEEIRSKLILRYLNQLEKLETLWGKIYPAPIIKEVESSCIFCRFWGWICQHMGF